MYQLKLFDKGYTFEYRWIFSRELSIDEMVKVVEGSFGDGRYSGSKLTGSEYLASFSRTLTPMVYIDFDRLELDDYILEVIADQ